MLKIAGRRLLKWVDSGQRTRYFFNGLTEEIRKVSVGTHSSGHFAFDDAEDGVAENELSVPPGASKAAVAGSARRTPLSPG